MNNFGNLLNLIKYPFIVARELTKDQIKFVLEKIFDVKILQINTCLLPIKKRRVGRFIGKKAAYKKAYVTLKEGNTISDLLQ